jgi:hypothetical protein
MEFEFQPEVENVDVIPAQFRPLYVAGTDGKHTLGENYKGVAEAVTGLNKALKAARKEKDVGKVDLSPLQEFGGTPDEIKTKIADKIKALETQLAEGGKVNVEKIKQEFAAQHGSELKKLSTRNEALQGQLYTLLVEIAATAEIVAAKGIPELVLPFVKPRVRVVEENGASMVYVLDDAGDRRFSRVTGLPMSVKELIDEIKADKRYSRLFDAEVKSGGGNEPSSGKVVGKAPATMTSREKISAGLANIKRGK